MAGVGIRIDATEARAELKRMIERARNPKPLLKRIGFFAVEKIRKRIKSGIPPAKHPYFAELQRRTGGMQSNTPLFVTGTLYDSITHNVVGKTSVRAGVPLHHAGTNMRYALTHQFGSDGPRSFYLYIIPDTVPGKRGMVYERNAYGFVLGKLTTREDWSKGGGGPAVRQLITVQVRPRPFLKTPDEREWDQILTMIQRHLEGAAA